MVRIIARAGKLPLDTFFYPCNIAHQYREVEANNKTKEATKYEAIHSQTISYTEQSQSWRIAGCLALFDADSAQARQHI